MIRGEETQVFGALARLKTGERALPAARVAFEMGCRRVRQSHRFATYMTGEIFAAARDHTILGRLMRDSRTSDAAFAKASSLVRGPAGQARFSAAFSPCAPPGSSTRFRRKSSPTI